MVHRAVCQGISGQASFKTLRVCVRYLYNSYTVLLKLCDLIGATEKWNSNTIKVAIN